MNRHVNAIAGRLSLRPPQRESLEILDRVAEIVPPRKDADVDAALAAIHSELSYIRGWALIHPTKATPEPEFIVADTLARVILNTVDDTVARNQVTAWLKDRNTQVAAIK